MILDAKNLQEAPDFLDVPVVIIGAGTVGLFLAVNLAQANIPTIVEETGGYVAGTSRSGQTAVSLGRSNSLGRAFGLGGTSTLWTGQLAEFDEIDLTASGREWPIEYSELQQWYEHVYAFLKMKPVKLVANPKTNSNTASNASSHPICLSRTSRCGSEQMSIQVRG